VRPDGSVIAEGAAKPAATWSEPSSAAQDVLPGRRSGCPGRSRWVILTSRVVAIGSDSVQLFSRGELIILFVSTAGAIAGIVALAAGTVPTTPRTVMHMTSQSGTKPSHGVYSE